MLDGLRTIPYSERSKAPIGSIPTPPSIDIGDLVYLYADRTKHHSRDRYLVTSVESDWCHLRKFVGSQLRQSPYRVKKSDCFKVASSLPTQHRPPAGSYSPDSSEDEEYPQAQSTAAGPGPPRIPEEIAAIPPSSSEGQHQARANLPTEMEAASSPRGRPPRARHPPQWLGDFVTDF